MRYPPTKKYDERGFAPPLTPGDYMIKVTEIQEKDKDGNDHADKNGYKYCLFIFSVKDFPGNKLFERITYDMECPYVNIALGRLKQLQIACGVDTDSECETDSLVGKTCKAYVKVKVYKDKPSNQIEEYKVTEEATEFKSDDDDLPF